MSIQKKILVVSQVYPYPLHDGGRFDVYYRLKALHEIGYDITLVAFYNPALPKPEIEPLQSYCSHIFPIPYLRRKLSKLVHWKPYSIASRENSEQIEKVIKSINLNQCEFRTILAESHHVLTVARKFQESLNIPSLCLRSHNYEPRFMMSLAQTSPKLSIRQIFFFVEACKYACYHPVLMRSMGSTDKIFHISHEECERGKKKYPKIKQSFLPAGIDLSLKKPFKCSDNKNVVFAGALFSPNNLQGLKWYIENIHPYLIKNISGYQLIVAGNTKGASRVQIENILSSVPALKFYDTPKDMCPVYEESQVFINPMQYGAGVKLKTVDALLRGLPVVTTTVGNEGTGFQDGQHVLVADNSFEFRESVRLLLDTPSRRKSLVESAQVFLEGYYDQKKALKFVL